MSSFEVTSSVNLLGMAMHTVHLLELGWVVLSVVNIKKILFKISFYASMLMVQLLPVCDTM
jgi:hypothetical protein